MNSKKFFSWCREAVSGIKYRPDRDAVYEELYSHLEDRYEVYLAQGFEPREAEDRALLAMGSAREIAPQLAAIHRPFWGYLLTASRWVLASLAVLTIVLSVHFFIRNDLWNASELSFCSYDVYADTSYQDENQSSVRILHLEPECSTRMDGYTITVTDAAWWKNAHTNREEQEIFYMRLNITNPRPWAEKPQGITMLWAEDSLGNRYDDLYAQADPSQGYLGGSLRRTGLFTYTYDLYLNDFVSQEAQWIDLRYNRDGRDITLRIDLTGGASQ